jgi:hypothetical protein
MNARFDPRLIEAIAAELRDMLGDDFDEATFFDTLDGETNALDVADKLIAGMQDADALAAAAKAQADALTSRARRLSDRSAAFKGRMLTLLDAIGAKKLERPAATISRRSGSVSVEIVAPDDVPRQLCRVSYAPDKTAIKRLLEAGEDVPGARLERGADGVTVRVG